MEERSYCNLGNAYERLGDLKTAINFYERGLKIAKEMDMRYGNLGIAYQSLGDLKRAIDCHERHLKITKEVRDKAGEGRAYNLVTLASLIKVGGISKPLSTSMSVI